VLSEFEKRGISLLYLTSSEKDPFFKESFKYIHGEYIGTGNRAFAKLNMLYADICLMTTPGLEVYQLKISKGVSHYSHILHDTGDATCYRLFGIDWFDSILLSGEYQKKDIRALERLRGTPQKELVVTGCSYLDVLLEKKEIFSEERDHAFTVLVSPSWGSGSLLNVLGEKLLDPLVNTGWRIIIRPHPQSKHSESDMLNRLETRYAGVPDMSWDYDEDNFLSLSKADIMISDYSGIIFDYIFLFGRPVLYSNAYFDLEMYDAGDLPHKPWKFEILREIGVELRESSLDHIKELINETVREFSPEKLEGIKNVAWQNIGCCGKNVAEYLISKQQEIRTKG
jgi:hypothetical protein